MFTSDIVYFNPLLQSKVNNCTVKFAACIAQRDTSVIIRIVNIAFLKERERERERANQQMQFDDGTVEYYHNRNVRENNMRDNNLVRYVLCRQFTLAILKPVLKLCFHQIEISKT